MLSRVFRWFERTVIELGREVRLSFLPPLMVYLAYGASNVTSIVGTFFVKDYLGLSAEFLAALGFWVGIPWVLKMPVGHLVDLLWRFKSILVYIGAGLIACSLAIMIGLLAHTDSMRAVMSVEAWFVISTLLGPVGFVLQDVVADAMTVEAIPRFDADGSAIDPAKTKLMHTTMQTLGRVALIGAITAVGVLNYFMFWDVAHLDEAAKTAIYVRIYYFAMIIPVLSVIGVMLGGVLRIRDFRRLKATGIDSHEAWKMVHPVEGTPKPNWWILGGSLAYVGFITTMGVAEVPFNQEIVFAGSLAIVLFLMWRLVLVLDASSRNVLVGTAIIIFVFRAIPGPGAGVSWWTIDILQFDQRFLSLLSIIGGSLTIFGMFIFRRFMAEKSIAYVVGFLTVVGAVLSLPQLSMFYGFHEWTAAHTNGVVDARFIAVIDTALESPLGQIAMIPMLAWIANSAPARLKATFFAVMASFTNLALSLSQLGTKYYNQIFSITREVKDKTGKISVPQDYSELGLLLWTVILVGLVMPFVAIFIVKKTRLRWA